MMNSSLPDRHEMHRFVVFSTPVFNREQWQVGRVAQKFQLTLNEFSFILLSQKLKPALMPAFSLTIQE